MKYSKIIFTIFCLVLFGFLFNFNAPAIKAAQESQEAATERLQELTAQLTNEILLLQERIIQLQDKVNQIQVQLSEAPAEETEEEEITTTCHTAPLWDWDYCSSVCKCEAGQGDCDSNLQCATGYCALDVGAKYGQDQWMDVCEEKPAYQPIIPSTEEKGSPLAGREEIGETTPFVCKDTDWFGTDKEGIIKRLTTKGFCEDVNKIYPDACFNSDILIDYFCNSSSGETETCLATYYSCEKNGFIGCENGTCFKEGSVSLSLAEDTPPSQNVLLGSDEATFLKVKFVTSDDEDIQINSLKVCLSNSQLNFDLKLYENKSQIGLVQSNIINDCVTFTDLNWILPKSSSKILTVKADTKGEITAPVKLFMKIEGNNVEVIGLVSGFSLSPSGSAVSNTMTITTQDLAALCTDSDEGINEYVYGEAAKEGVTYHDICFLGDNLKEWVCTAAGNITYKLVECEYGCVDGVCKKADGNDESTGIVCIDSDGGKNYETYGKVIHGNGETEIYDACESEAVLKEYFCENGYFASETYECPSGCFNGACVSTMGFKNIENSLSSISEAALRLMEDVKELIGK
jgi:hypothetical protein